MKQIEKEPCALWCFENSNEEKQEARNLNLEMEKNHQNRKTKN